MKKLRIGLIVGHFNPPHLGHRYLAQRALEKKVVDAVWMVPLPLPDNKDFYIHQKYMTALLLHDISHVYFCELNEDNDKLFDDPDFEISLLSGTDNYWNPSDEFILTKLNLPVIWMERPGQSRIREKCLYGNFICNSTQIRENIHKYKNWLPKEVLQYIEKEKLYGI